MEFNLSKGDIEEFAILEESLPKNLESLMVDNSIQVKLNVEDREIALINTVKYMIEERSLLKIRSVLYFKIEDASWDENFKDNCIVLRKDHLQHLGIITIGATRGMLIAKCMNTEFSKLILPPVDMNELLYEDIVLEIK